MPSARRKDQTKVNDQKTANLTTLTFVGGLALVASPVVAFIGYTRTTQGALYLIAGLLLIIVGLLILLGRLIWKGQG